MRKAWWNPFRRPEARSGYGHDLAVLSQALAAKASAADPTRTAAVEIAAGALGRALALAELSPEGSRLRLVTPAVRAHIGRDLIRNGNSVWALEPDGLVSVASWEVSGDSPHRNRWQYRMDLPAPSGARSVTVPGAGVLHFTWARAPGQPWLGIAPLTAAEDSGRMLAALEDALADEAGGARGYLLPIPTGGQDASVEALRKDIGGLSGKTALVETTAAGYGEGMGAAPRRDWMTSRIGANPPISLVTLRQDEERCALAACGFPPGLLDATSETASREAYRRWLYSSVEPVATQVGEELALKLEVERVEWNFDRLRAADVTGRARAFKALREAGVTEDEAKRVSGIGG